MPKSHMPIGAVSAALYPPYTSALSEPAPEREGGSLHALVANEIGQRIVRGDYPPGSILPNEATWAETFKVSRSAVREAVKMLTAKSLLASRPKIGSRVEPRTRWNLLDRDVLGWYATSPDPRAFLRMVQEFRHLVEPEAAALAAARHGPEDMAEIARHHRDMTESPSPEAWRQSDIRFHAAILAASGNELLLPLSAMVEAALNHLFVHLRREDVVLRDLKGLHEAIVRAIRGRRPEAARKAMRALLDNTDTIIAHKFQAIPSGACSLEA